MPFADVADGPILMGRTVRTRSGALVLPADIPETVVGQGPLVVGGPPAPAEDEDPVVSLVVLVPATGRRHKVEARLKETAAALQRRVGVSGTTPAPARPPSSSPSAVHFRRSCACPSTISGCSRLAGTWSLTAWWAHTWSNTARWWRCTQRATARSTATWTCWAMGLWCLAPFFGTRRWKTCTRWPG